MNAATDATNPAEWPVISSYSRAQAVEEGFLVDVSATAREAGIKFPVCLTRDVWDRYVEVPDGDEFCQDEAGRLWDVLWMFRRAAARCEGGAYLVVFHLHIRNDNRRGMPPRVTLKAQCHGGDSGEPVVTIMTRYED